MPKLSLTSIFIFSLLLIIGQSYQYYTTSPSDTKSLSTLEAPHTEVLSIETTSNTRQSLFPITGIEIGGFILIMFIAGLANAGGLGGGPLLSPILIMVFNYSESHAIEMVYSLVFGASLGNFCNVVAKRDPKTGKPLVEYSLGLVCMPLMLLGASFGVILNRMLAPLITIIGILGVTLFSLIKLYIKARKSYEQESCSKALIDQTSSFAPETVISEGDDLSYGEVDPELRAVLEEEKQMFPKLKIFMTVVLVAVIMLIAVLRGTQSFKSIIGVSYCGAEYWGLLGVSAILCCSILLINRRIIKPAVQIKKKYNIVSTETRFELSEEHVTKLLILSLIAGILAGLLGIGGGMVMNPTLISIGVPAQSLGATAGFFVVQTSFISIFQSILYRDVPLTDLGFFFLISIVGSYGVSFLLSILVRRYNRPSLVLFTLVGVLLLSLITTPIFEIVSNIGNFGQMLKFNEVC